MSDVYQRPGSTIWYANFTTPDGRRVRRSTGCGNRRQAQRIADQWAAHAEQAVADAVTGVRRATDIALADLFGRFLAACESRRLKPSSVANYTTYAEAYSLRYFGAERVAATITREDVETFVQRLADGVWTPSGGPGPPPGAATVKHAVGALRRALKFGVRRGLLVANPAADVEPVRGHTAQTFRALTNDEITAWLAAMVTPGDRHDRRRVENRLVAARKVRFVLATGIRREEAHSVRASWIDLRAGVMNIPAAATKNRLPRIVPLTTEARAVLEEVDAYLERTTGGSPWAGPLLGASTHGAVMASSWAATELPGRSPTWHDLRVTCASRVAAAGAGLSDIMTWFGWQSPAVAQRYIRQWGDTHARLAEIVDRMEGR